MTNPTTPFSWQMPTASDLVTDLPADFETFGQVWYTDENGRPWIKEFRGGVWTKEIILKDNRKIGFSVFVNNQFQEAGRYVTLTKKVNNEIEDQKEFKIDAEKVFDGWFRLG